MVLNVQITQIFTQIMTCYYPVKTFFEKLMFFMYYTYILEDRHYTTQVLSKQFMLL